MSEKLNLQDIRSYHFTTGMFNPGNAILTWLRNEDAFWEYNGEPSPDKPHAELSDGACSNGFIDMPSILQYPHIAEILGRELARKLVYEYRVEADVVVSSAYSALTFGHEVAKELGAIFRHPIKDPTDPKQKRMLWRGKPIPSGSCVLQVEELITTMSTTLEVRKAVKEAHKDTRLYWNETVGTLVHRPKSLSVVFMDMSVVTLMEKEMENFTENCPYCAIGSKKLRPRDNWAELTGA